MKRLSFSILIVILCISGGLGVAAQNDPIDRSIEDNTTFAFDLYHALDSSESGNLVFSPYSVSQALAMTWSGARGETATQMADALHLSLDRPTVATAFQTLNDDLRTRGTAAANPDFGIPAMSLQIANGLWGEQTFPFDPGFGDELTTYYDAELHPVDFIGDPDGVANEIDRWVADRTNDRIQNIVPEGSLTDATRLVLANAIYFYGGWEVTFDEHRTEIGDFILNDGSAVSTPFMHQQYIYPYVAGDGYQLVELPYAGSGFAFTVILPDSGRFDEIEATLDPALLAAAIDQTEMRDIVLALPKFSFDTSAGLNEILQTMGMIDAFDPNRADFSGMLDGSTPDSFFVDQVLHKAFIGIDENGTEAAAVTAVMMAGTGAPTEPPLAVDIDRPFIFLIRDTQTGTILFMGRVMNPEV